MEFGRAVENSARLLRLMVSSSPNRRCASDCFVTFTQQAAFFCRQSAKSPKKAAVAPVFGLPRMGGRRLNLPVLHVKNRSWSIVAG